MYLIDTILAEKLRKEKNITRRKLGKLIGFKSESSIYLVLNKGTVKSKLKVLGLCRVLGCEPDQLVTYAPKGAFNEELILERAYRMTGGKLNG
jgi:DNA-binding Xre family transcriptional regulator